MMSFLRFKLPVVLLIVATASYVAFLEVEASEDSDEQVSEGSTWEPTQEDLAHLQHACNPAQPGYASCFINKMSERGASDEATAFTRQYAEHNDGVVAILEDFRPVDSVDLGFAYFPSASEAKHGWLLLNGVPPIINVDNLDSLPENLLEKDALYDALQSSHHRARLMLDDSERSPGRLPQIETRENSDQRFIVPYAIRDGCHSCALLGHVYYSFDFDPTGQMLGVRYVRFAPETAAGHGH